MGLSAMQNPFVHFWIFLYAVWDHAFTLAAGCVVTVVINLIEKYALKGKKLPAKADIAILLLFVFFATFQAWRDQYDKVKAILPNTTIQVNVPTQPPPQVQVSVPPSTVNFPPQMAFFGPDGSISLGNYGFGKYIAVSSTCKNFSQSVPAENAMCWFKSSIVDTKPNSQNQSIVAESVQDTAFEIFEKSLIPLRNGQRTTLGPGESHFGTSSPALLDEKLDIALRAGTKTILLAAEYNWKDGAGSHTNQLCKWLQLGPEMPTIFSGPGILSSNVPIIWNSCTRHNGLIQR
jgi:hypothetical protein